ncbi:MAG TPA: DUF4365 domain-containing protein [Stellaceae bacterium]|nr:DUF4365 domain-containing protein [Stellaceae bacterium]
MKTLSQNQLIGQRGEHLVAERTLSMGFAFNGCNRLETGIDGFLELRDPQTGRTLAQWIGAQVKTTDTGPYAYEDADGFEYLLKPDDLAYWRQGSNIPVIIVLVRLSEGSMYWKPVDAGAVAEPRRLRFDKAQDRFDKSAADRIASLCIARDRPGSYVPPMQSGEVAHITMVHVALPEDTYVWSAPLGPDR